MINLKANGRAAWVADTAKGMAHTDLVESS